MSITCLILQGSFQKPTQTGAPSDQSMDGTPAIQREQNSVEMTATKIAAVPVPAVLSSEVDANEQDSERSALIVRTAAPARPIAALPAQANALTEVETFSSFGVMDEQMARDFESDIPFFRVEDDNKRTLTKPNKGQFMLCCSLFCIPCSCCYLYAKDAQRAKQLKIATPNKQ